MIVCSTVSRANQLCHGEAYFTPHKHLFKPWDVHFPQDPSNTFPQQALRFPVMRSPLPSKSQNTPMTTSKTGMTLWINSMRRRMDFLFLLYIVLLGCHICLMRIHWNCIVRRIHWCCIYWNRLIHWCLKYSMLYRYRIKAWL